jgi:hypothetical protein
MISKSTMHIDEDSFASRSLGPQHLLESSQKYSLPVTIDKNRPIRSQFEKQTVKDL